MDVGWCLRADFHRATKPPRGGGRRRSTGSNLGGFFRGASAPVAHGGRETQGGPSTQRPDRRRCSGGGRSCGPTGIHRCDSLRAQETRRQGKPCAARVRVPETHEQPVRLALACGVPQVQRGPIASEGGNALASVYRSLFGSPRHGAGGQPRLRRNGFATVETSLRCEVFGENGEEGADPGDRVRLPTRSKPSKGIAPVGKPHRSEARRGEIRDTPRTIGSKPGEPQVRRRDATGPRPFCGESRRSGPRTTGAEREPRPPCQGPNRQAAMPSGGVDAGGSKPEEGQKTSTWERGRARGLHRLLRKARQFRGASKGTIVYHRPKDLLRGPWRSIG
jgi:hypothetical protein